MVENKEQEMPLEIWEQKSTCYLELQNEIGINKSKNIVRLWLFKVGIVVAKYTVSKISQILPNIVDYKQNWKNDDHNPDSKSIYDVLFGEMLDN